MIQKDTFSKTPMQHAFQITVIIGILYTISKYFDIASPKGNAFISYIIPALFGDVVLVVFPLLFIFFYFKDGEAIKDIKKNMFNNNCEVDERDTREVLREYHGMLKEGIITQEEFELIKKKYLKKINKDWDNPSNSNNQYFPAEISIGIKKKYIYQVKKA